MMDEASCMGPNKQDLALQSLQHRIWHNSHFPSKAWCCLGEQEFTAKHNRHHAKPSTLTSRSVCVCHSVPYCSPCSPNKGAGQAKDAANLELASTAIKQAGWDVWDAELYSQGGFSRLCWM